MATSDEIPVPNRLAVVHSDNRQILGTVGTSYVPVENHQAFGYLDAVDAVVADGSLRYYTAGYPGSENLVLLLQEFDILGQFVVCPGGNQGQQG